MQITLRAKIHNQSNYFLLEQMGEHLSQVKRKLFVRYGIQKESVSELKKEFLIGEEVTARQFNSLAYEIKGLISAQREINQNLIQKTKKKVKLLKEKIKGSKSAFRMHQWRRQLERQQNKLLTYQGRLKKPSVCFGEKKLFQKQFFLKENGFRSHQEWKDQWSRVRNGSFFLIGSKDESFGNQLCQLIGNRLQLRLTDRLAQRWGTKYLFIPVNFTYRQELLQVAIASGQALHYRFVRQENGYWYVHLTFELSEIEPVTQFKYGAIGVDLNPSCIAVTHLDPDGNYLSSRQIPVQLKGKSSEQVKAILGDCCLGIVQDAREHRVPIILEELDFENRKLQLRSRGMNRMLSQFTYSQMNATIHSQAKRVGVQVKEVNPAYTSTIGKVKFSLGYGLSTHMGAAMAIARRGLGFGERLCAKSKNRLSLPVRNRASTFGQIGDKSIRRFFRRGIFSGKIGSVPNTLRVSHHPV